MRTVAFFFLLTLALLIAEIIHYAPRVHTFLWG